MPLILLRKKKYKDATLKTLIYLLTRLRKNEKTAFLLEIKNILAGKIKEKMKSRPIGFMSLPCERCKTTCKHYAYAVSKTLTLRICLKWMKRSIIKKNNFIYIYFRNVIFLQNHNQSYYCLTYFYFII